MTIIFIESLDFKKLILRSLIYYKYIITFHDYLFYVPVYRQGEIGSSWYAVLGGSLEARLSQNPSTSTDKVSYENIIVLSPDYYQMYNITQI